MRKKNLILLTSITGLLLTLTPSQALAQESTTPTSTSQSSSDKDTDNKDENKKLPTDEKCHWKGETPVPENKYLKMLYDAAYYDYEENLEKIKNGEYLPEELKELVNNGKMSENEAKYRALLLHDREYKDNFSYNLRQFLEVTIDPGWVKEIVKEAYDNPDNADEIVKEMIDAYSLKDHLEYVDKFVQPDIHVSYSSKELHDKYQKEFDELDKVMEYDKNQRYLWDLSDANDNFKVTKLLDGFDNEQEQVERFVKLHYWLETFPLKEDIDPNNYTASELGSYSGYVAGSVKELNYVLKQKNLFNDNFYDNVEDYLRSVDYQDGKDHSYEFVEFLKDEYDIKFSDFMRSPKSSSDKEDFKVKPLLFDPYFEIPSDVVCDDDEEPEESTTPTTSTVEDKTETPTTTSTTTNKKKSDTKTTSKEKSTTSKEKPEEPIKEDKEDNNTTPEKPIEKENNSNKTPNTINNPNTKPVQSGFTPVNNTKPGTFNGGVSSSVEGEEISDGSTVDTGSPTTSILNKIRTIF